MENLEKDLVSLNDQERKYAKAVIEEYSAKGYSSLLDNLWYTDYKDKPVSFDEFIDKREFLGTYGRTLPEVWRRELRDLTDPNSTYIELICTGAIGTYKTTSCIAILLYKLYCLLCLRDPQEYYGQLPGSPIGFALFNLTRELSESVEYKRLRALLLSSEYFRDICSYDKKGREGGDILNFPNDIYFIFGSQAYHAIGQTIFGGMVDEANFSKTPEHRQIIGQYDETWGRIRSRFMNTVTGRVPGILCLASSPRTQDDFLDKHIRDVMDAEERTGIKLAKVVKLAIWDVKPPPEGSKKFFVLVGDKLKSSKILGDDEVHPEGARLIEVPEVYRADFERDLETSIQNIAGESVRAINPLIALRERVYDCVDKTRKHPFADEEVIISVGSDLTIDQVFKLNEISDVVDQYRRIYRPKLNPRAARYIHVDGSKSDDSTGIGMVHIGGVIETWRTYLGEPSAPGGVPIGEKYRVIAPIVYVDFMLRIVPPGGNEEIDLGKICDFIQFLRTFGFPVKYVSYDQFQSTLSMQILNKMGVKAKYISVDRTPDPYRVLKECINERRISYYAYEPFFEEIVHLQVDEKTGKVYHLPDKSKDVVDGICGAVWSAITDKDVKEYAFDTSVDVALASIKRSEESELKSTSDSDWLIDDYDEPGLTRIE